MTIKQQPVYKICTCKISLFDQTLEPKELLRRSNHATIQVHIQFKTGFQIQSKHLIFTQNGMNVINYKSLPMTETNTNLKCNHRSYINFNKNCICILYHVISLQL